MYYITTFFKSFFSIFFNNCNVSFRKKEIPIVWVSDTEFKTLENIIIKVSNSPFGTDFKQFVFAGFKSDGASIPWIFQPIIGAKANNKNIRGAISHDELYRDVSQSISSKSNRVVSRAESDFIFYKILRRDGMPFWKCLLIFYSVRFFGYKSYSKKIIINKKELKNICTPTT